MTDKTSSSASNQSTAAAFKILEEMARIGDPSRVTDLANKLGMPRARIYRYLQTLVNLGYVRQDPQTERYQLTLKLFHLGQAIADSTQLTSVARPIMAALRDQLAHTITLSLPEDDGMRVADIVRIDSPVQIITRPGALLGFHTSAQGKVALAFGEARLERLDLDAASKDRLAEEITQTRQRGWAVAPQETLPGVNAVSAPIFDHENQFVATLTVVGSVQTLKPDPEETVTATLMQAARQISSDLGCMEYPI
ncbi:MAG: hypothetical protein CMN17_13515 [Roseovarius sp.]|jgi:DNA-binding IclR family transcriptional regulator|nr:hypothetical protein [Roseovarius sp.]|tara:strand:- start:411 stop:1166 length:756 start_codon:yes stop_codon:yes gene_type:complete